MASRLPCSRALAMRAFSAGTECRMFMRKGSSAPLRFFRCSGSSTAPMLVMSLVSGISQIQPS